MAFFESRTMPEPSSGAIGSVFHCSDCSMFSVFRGQAGRVVCIHLKSVHSLLHRSF